MLERQKQRHTEKKKNIVAKDYQNDTETQSPIKRPLFLSGLQTGTHAYFYLALLSKDAY